MSNPHNRRFITATYNQTTMVNEVSLTENEDLAYSYDTRALAEIAIEIAKAQGITEPLAVEETKWYAGNEPSTFRVVSIVKEEPRTWRNQFPETFAVPDELDNLVKFGLLEDTSWGNDASPSFEFDGYEGSKETKRRFHREGLKPSRYRVWADASDPKLREFSDSSRFSLFFRDEDERERTDNSVLFHTDDVNEMVDAITMRFFQAFTWSIGDDGPWCCPFRDCESSDIDETEGSYTCEDCGRIWTLLEESLITGVLIDEGMRQCRDCDRTEGLIVSKCEGVKLQFCPDDYKVHTKQWCDECPKLAE